VTRVLLVLAVVLLAVVVAEVVRRRRPDPPTQPASHEVPAQLDRSDFPSPGTSWLVAVFTSATCSTCAAVWERAQVLACDDVVVVEAEVQRDPGLHERYRITAVPLLVVADSEGVVRQQFLGPVSSTHLWGALAELRHPGSVPPGCESH